MSDLQTIHQMIADWKVPEDMFRPRGLEDVKATLVTIAAAFTAGALAADLGAPLVACPHAEHSPERKPWCDGWLSETMNRIDRTK